MCPTAKRQPASIDLFIRASIGAMLWAAGVAHTGSALAQAAPEAQLPPSLRHAALRLSDAQAPATVLLRSVTLEGATALGEADLAPAYATVLGQRVAEADLTAITAAITAIYREAGYGLSRAIIPAQDLSGGRVRIQVIEGTVEDIVIVGDDANRFGLQALLAPIAAERPLRRATLERQLLLANDRPGVRVTDTVLDEIVPASGRFRLTVKVQAWTVFGAVGLDNLGSTAVGPWQGSASVAANSVFVPGDTLALNGASTLGSWRELGFASLAYDAPIGTDSFRLGAAVSHGEVRPGDERRWTRTRSEFDTLEVRAWYAPWVSPSHTLWLGGGLGTSGIRERDRAGTIYDTNFGLLSLYADDRLHLTETSWTYLYASLRVGLGPVGDKTPSRDPNQLGEATRFSAFSASLAHYQNLTETVSIKLAAAGQVASGPLPVTQQYYLGAYSFGRGFETGWISGDNALAGSAELRYDIPVRMPYLNALQLYGFAEGGMTETYLIPNRLVQKIASVGIGVRFFITNDLLAGLAIAKPVVDTAVYRKRDDIALLFSLTNTFHVNPDFMK